MYAYHFSESNSEFLGATSAFEDPKNVGQFLIPRNATDIAPPNVGVNKTAMFNGGGWEIVADYRGQDFYDKNSGDMFTILNINVDPLENWTDMQPPELVEFQAALFNEVLNEWEIIADYRGWHGYDENGQPVSITETGIVPAENWTLELPPEPEKVTQYSSRTFMNRLTLAEKTAIKQSTDITVLLGYDELLAADFVDVEDSATIQYANYAFSVGILETENRVTELLAVTYE